MGKILPWKYWISDKTVPNRCPPWPWSMMVEMYINWWCLGFSNFFVFGICCSQCVCVWAETGGWWMSEWNSVSGRSDSIRNMELIPLQFPDNTNTKIHTSNISALTKISAPVSNKHIRTSVALPQLSWHMQTSARTPTFSGLLMIYLGKTFDETSAGRGVIWALLWGLCSSDENILVFKASCWEPPLCVLISTTPIQI